MSMLPPETDRPSFSDVGNVGNFGISSLPLAPVGGPPSYPPTEVKRWLTCPVFWRLSKVWQPRCQLWTPHKLVGTAIHAGLGARLVQIKDQPSSQAVSPDLSPILALALGVLGEGYIEQETWGLDGLAKLVERGIRVLSQAIETRLLPGAHILAVEYADPTSPLPPGVHVPRTLDCLLERDGALEVWDWKTTINLDDRYLPEKGREVLHSWQLLDYAWHAQQWFQRPVTAAGQGLVVLGPGKPKAHFLPVTLSPERLTQWRKDAMTIWTAMFSQSAEGYQPMWHNWTACTDRHLHYGKECEFMPACHIYNDNEALFPGLYERVVL